MNVTVFPGSKSQSPTVAVDLLADLTAAFAIARATLADLSKHDFLLTRGEVASFDTSVMDLDGWRALLALIEVIGGEMPKHLERKV
ncbi:hypothetical protein [Mesorhizobium helmanticense]|uniref:Uncharacterized protein n=1 Tax=Mesorhizobium helmanticense TaxID=1776423 RepID=A0A2T4J0V1_9HYPH|nr:hypothetical protein [Mesorhizobium helmanticense]PTE11541.1 hypothetical protein C9427_04785 [Mesorhizobium helmanticense]